MFNEEPLAGQLAPVLAVIPVGIAASRFEVLRSSGLWIWVPGFVAIVDEIYVFGPQIARRELLSADSVGLLITIATVACASYSLTLLLIASLFPQDFEGLLTEDAEAGEPAGGVGKQRREQDGDE